MKKLKRVLSLTVAAAIMAASVDVSNVMAAEVDHEGVVLNETEVSEESDFVIDENGVLVKYQGAAEDVVVPEGVVSIGNSAFAGCGSLKSVELPAGLKSIESSAFERCSLSSIKLPDD